MTVLAALLVGAPALASLIGFLLPYRLRTAAAVLGIAGAGVALAAAILLVPGRARPRDSHITLAHFGSLDVTLGARVDGRAALVAIAVCVVALAVQVYSVAYLEHDDRYAPYAAQVSLFTAAMLTVVVSGDLIVLLVGWEVMGICSYLLIGHDRTLPEAPAAAVKAFLVTRVGDVGFLLGIVILGVRAGTFRIGDVLAAVADGRVGGGWLTAAALLLLAGVFGKSAQFPLHTWLPDAMAGPTPISALIHAATMVAAGIYVVARLYPVFAASRPALVVLGISASVTMLLGAFAATAQDDIKRVLAWSTVSQLGYMAGALAVGAVPAALFHLLTHAAFKALLFLAAGAVIHAVGTNSMAGMGGLRRQMPVTFWCMTIGLAALAGLPPLAGFWSKDLILARAQEAGGWLSVVVYLSGLATVLVTAWYATRLWKLTFFGTYRGGPALTLAPSADGWALAAAPGTPASAADAALAPHDPPALMRWPVMLLAIPAAGLGVLVIVPAVRGRLGTTSLAHFDLWTLLPLAALALGVWAAWRGEPDVDPVVRLGLLRQPFSQAFYLDAVQDAVVVRPVRAIARVVLRADKGLVDGAVEGIGVRTTRVASRLATANGRGLPRYATGALAGGLLVGVVALVSEVLR